MLSLNAQSGGNLRRPMNVHMEVFTDELAFYQLGADVIHQFRVDEGLVDVMAKPLPANAFQRAVWTLLENPESSLAARIIAILSVSVIVLSIATFCLETLPELKRYQVKVIRSTNVETGSASYLPNEKAYELLTWYTDGERRPVSPTGAVTSNVKGQGAETLS